MLKSIFLSYDERNPVGVRQWRYDECSLHSHTGYVKENKEMVRKAIEFMFKLDRNDCIPCDIVRFDFDEFRYVCEVRNEDVWNRNRIITVTRYYGTSSHDEPYRIDAATFRKLLYKACDDLDAYLRALEEVAA